MQSHASVKGADVLLLHILIAYQALAWFVQNCYHQIALFDRLRVSGAGAQAQLCAACEQQAAWYLHYACSVDCGRQDC